MGGLLKAFWLFLVPPLAEGRGSKGWRGF